MLDFPTLNQFNYWQSTFNPPVTTPQHCFYPSGIDKSSLEQLKSVQVNSSDSITDKTATALIICTKTSVMPSYSLSKGQVSCPLAEQKKVCFKQNKQATLETLFPSLPHTGSYCPNTISQFIHTGNNSCNWQPCPTSTLVHLMLLKRTPIEVSLILFKTQLLLLVQPGIYSTPYLLEAVANHTYSQVLHAILRPN